MKARLPDEYRSGKAGMMARLQKMQDDIKAAQEEVENSSFEASAGGGAVSATVTGAKQVTGISISPDVLDPDDIEMLQDLVIAAVNEALSKADSAMEARMAEAQAPLAGLAGGMGDFPGM
ncbi:MAG: YbaB/EbfC family nucleoid-associated protein [Oscillospiraceae bacterium]|jgi:DNA-binding YbaB/EbfC family protein|nr:YbaB/EbfC family nucleoid-associated protein [Oscillospiraceae bacterium]